MMTVKVYNKCVKKAANFALKGSKKREQKLEQQDKELGNSIVSFLSVVKTLEKDKARKKANEKAIGVLAS